MSESDGKDWFIAAVLQNPVNGAILERGWRLQVADWWLVAGAVFQTVWNVMDGRNPAAGINDYDLFYFDPTDLSWEAEDAVIRRAAALFGDLEGLVEVRNEARVHLWYEDHFGVPGRPFSSSRDAVDHFASTTCCYALTADEAKGIEVYAPHGYDDLFAQRVRPNPVLATREVYEAKTARWLAEWPRLSVEPWPAAPVRTAVANCQVSR
ncbi:MAG: nucleotidyltransferase family protein [Acidimicrobiales bacterium]